MSSPSQYGSQARVAAEGRDAGPQIGPNRGPTNRRDLLIAIGAVVVVVAAVLALVFA